MSDWDPLPFNLFLIKSIIEAHKGVFKRNCPHTAVNIWSVKVLGQWKTGDTHHEKRRRVKNTAWCSTLWRCTVQTRSQDKLWEQFQRLSFAFILDASFGGKLTILPESKLNYFTFMNYFIIQYSLRIIYLWLNNCDWTFTVKELTATA